MRRAAEAEGLEGRPGEFRKGDESRRQEIRSRADPKFVDPKFRDRVWEEGGPRLSALNKGKLVKGIRIVGNQTISSHKILSHMQTRQDRNYDEKQLQADIHELYRTELFRKITPSVADHGDGVVVTLEIVEQPTVTDVIFHGNTRIDDQMLEKHCGIKVGDPANPFSADRWIQA